MIESPCAYIVPPVAVVEPTSWTAPHMTFDPTVAYYCADMIQRMYSSSCSNNPNTAPLPLLPPSWTLLGMIQGVSSGKQEPFGMLLEQKTNNGVGMLAIRGSVTNQDWMVDQEWGQTNVTNYFLGSGTTSRAQLLSNSKAQFLDASQAQLLDASQAQLLGASGAQLLVHTGFWTTYQSMAAQLYSLLENSKINLLYITGHSLGSALAWLAAADLWHRYGTKLNIRLYPIATPRFANPAFVDFIDTATTASIQERYQLLNFSDIVPTLPLAVTPHTFHPEEPYLYQQTRQFIIVDQNLGSYSLNHQLSTYQTILLTMIQKQQESR